jgi:hypothetical protein
MAAWHRLGLPTTAPPDGPDLVVGQPFRVFVVEAGEQPSGVRLVLLREVTHERQAPQAKDELLAILGHVLRICCRRSGLRPAHRSPVGHRARTRLTLRREPLAVDDLEDRELGATVLHARCSARLLSRCTYDHHALLSRDRRNLNRPEQLCLTQRVPNITRVELVER